MRKHLLLTTAISTLVLSLGLTACQKPADTSSTPASGEKNDTTTQTPTTDTPNTKATAVDLTSETNEYKKWVENEIAQLVTGTEKFVAALKAGNVEEAKKLYPLVRMHFERSEPIAEIFDDLDPRIDNREADLEQNEAWTGFHAIEKILWIQNTTDGTDKLGEQLLLDIKELNAKIVNAQVTGELMIDGSVDLLNEISTTKITGEEEIFSKTDLYDFKANIEGAEKIFVILTPKIEAKDPNLVATLKERFLEVHNLLDKHKIGDKDYKAFDTLSQDETKALAEAVNELGEPLSQMGIIMQ